MPLPSFLNLPPLSHPIPPLQMVTEHQAELPALYSNFPLVIYFTRSNVYVSMLLSQFIPPSPSPTESINLLSMSECLLLPCKIGSSIPFFQIPYILALIYDICFSPFDLLHSLRQALGTSTSLELTQMCSFLWLSN